VAIKDKQREAVCCKLPLTAFCMAGDIFFIGMVIRPRRAIVFTRA
jgi:hypothetical protein